MWGVLLCHKIVSPPFPVLKAGHPVSCSCVCVLYGLVRWVSSLASVLQKDFPFLFCSTGICYNKMDIAQHLNRSKR